MTPAAPTNDPEILDTLRDAVVVVAGLGTSGRSAAQVLAELGARVTVVDGDPEADGADLPGGVTVLADADGARLADAVLALAPALLVASPGWRPDHPVLAAAVATGLPVWSEVELAWRIADPATHWLALTGTNGKTTTVGMLASILAAAGRTAPAVGNVGTPIARTVLDARVAGTRLDALAVELSSFQLHFTHSMAPQAAAVLNLADDHIDWHGSLEEYAAAKARIFERTRVACVYNVADEATLRMVEGAEVTEGARAIGFTLGTPSVSQVGLVEDALVDRAFLDERHTHGQVLAELADLEHLGGGGPLPPHVVANALAAAALARADGVTPEQVARGLREFDPGHHRIELVASHDGVRYVDDSKATNAHAAAAALASVEPGTAVWIAGGLAKGARFEELVISRRDRLRAVVLIGVDDEPIRDALERHAPDVPRVRVDPGDHEVMRTAVSEAARLARPGDTVLLAPACASMDQFRSYAERGDAFAAAAREVGA